MIFELDISVHISLPEAIVLKFEKSPVVNRKLVGRPANHERIESILP
jgi:hypothetical protein